MSLFAHRGVPPLEMPFMVSRLTTSATFVPFCATFVLLLPLFTLTRFNQPMMMTFGVCLIEIESCLPYLSRSFQFDSMQLDCLCHLAM